VVPHSPSHPLCSRFSLRELGGQVWQDLTQPHCSCCHSRVGEAQLVPRHNSGLQLLRSEGLQAGGHVGVSNGCKRKAKQQRRLWCERGAAGQAVKTVSQDWRSQDACQTQHCASALRLLHDASGCIYCCSCALEA